MRKILMLVALLVVLAVTAVAATSSASLAFGGGGVQHLACQGTGTGCSG
jgi:hypothetical protein